MAVKFAEDVRNARLDAIETVCGTAPVLKLRSGAPPTNISDADTGDVIATLTLPSDWMNAASGGQKTKAGTWEDTAADMAGTVGHFRIYLTGGTTQKIQGTVTITGSGGDMTLDNNVVAVNQVVTITGFTLTDGNA